MWDYAKLSAEASKLGGPAALRAAYALAGRTKGLEKGFATGLRAGRTQGVVVGAGVVYVGFVGNAVYKTLRARSVVSADAEPAPEGSMDAQASDDRPDAAATTPPG
ncbi:hypothetical protein ACFY7V_03525 [[Kitasatospora] papulosa]|uniref:hypothetical protein n=1 Tax=Streptomyces TaxID=1883 RepID=UPI002FF0D768